MASLSGGLVVSIDASCIVVGGGLAGDGFIMTSGFSVGIFALYTAGVWLGH